MASDKTATWTTRNPAWMFNCFTQLVREGHCEVSGLPLYNASFIAGALYQYQLDDDVFVSDCIDERETRDDQRDTRRDVDEHWMRAQQRKPQTVFSRPRLDGHISFATDFLVTIEEDYEVYQPMLTSKEARQLTRELKLARGQRLEATDKRPWRRFQQDWERCKDEQLDDLDLSVRIETFADRPTATRIEREWEEAAYEFGDDVDEPYLYDYELDELARPMAFSVVWTENYYHARPIVTVGLYNVLTIDDLESSLRAMAEKGLLPLSDVNRYDLSAQDGTLNCVIDEQEAAWRLQHGRDLFEQYRSSIDTLDLFASVILFDEPEEDLHSHIRAREDIFEGYGENDTERDPISNEVDDALDRDFAEERRRRAEQHVDACIEAEARYYIELDRAHELEALGENIDRSLSRRITASRRRGFKRPLDVA